MPNDRSHGPNFAPESPKDSMGAALLRNKLAPDVAGLNPDLVTTNTLEEAQGTLPANRELNALSGVDSDDHRVPGRSGPAGPM